MIECTRSTDDQAQNKQMIKTYRQTDRQTDSWAKNKRVRDTKA